MHDEECWINHLHSNLLTHREILMMRVMNAITDKADWGKKVCLLAASLCDVSLISVRSSTRKSLRNGAKKSPRVGKT